MKGFKSFLMQGELIVIAVGLVVALAFSTLIKAFTDNIITPLINAASGGGPGAKGLGCTVNGQRITVGAFISAVAIPSSSWRSSTSSSWSPTGDTCSGAAPRSSATQRRPRPAPHRQSSDLPVAATRCAHCTSELSAASA